MSELIISDEAREAAETLYKKTEMWHCDIAKAWPVIQLAINSATSSHSALIAELVKCADGLRDALQFCDDYKRENCNGQIGWRNPRMSEAIAGDVKVHHILTAESALTAYPNLKKEHKI